MEPKKQLYAVTTEGIGQHYVIATGFDDAARQVKEWADANNYGHYYDASGKLQGENDRVITTVSLVAPIRGNVGLLREILLFIDGQPQ